MLHFRMAEVHPIKCSRSNVKFSTKYRVWALLGVLFFVGVFFIGRCTVSSPATPVAASTSAYPTPSASPTSGSKAPTEEPKPKSPTPRVTVTKTVTPKPTTPIIKTVKKQTPKWKFCPDETIYTKSSDKRVRVYVCPEMTVYVYPDKTVVYPKKPTPKVTPKATPKATPTTAPCRLFMVPIRNEGEKYKPKNTTRAMVMGFRNETHVYGPMDFGPLLDRIASYGRDQSVKELSLELQRHWPTISQNLQQQLNGSCAKVARVDLAYGARMIANVNSTTARNNTVVEWYDAREAAIEATS
jgi:hypothetical protein